jgi:citrate lyase subunit beta/citryl-CoA lyase
VRAVLFGAEDFSADVGITRTPGEPELLYARCALVTACRAASCQAIDSPCIDFNDLEQTRQAAQRARNLGFSGKLAIHPTQLSVLNAVFSPSEAEVQEARRILAAYSGSGAGVITMDGKMIDEAIVRKARDILR